MAVEMPGHAHDDIGNSEMCVILAFWIRDNILFRDSTVQHSIWHGMALISYFSISHPDYHDAQGP
jgi:hypothetical protein